MKRSHLVPKPVNLESPAPARARRSISKTQNQADWFKIENKKNVEADVYIYDEIGFWGTSASDFSSQLRDLDVTKINLHLNSPGGEVFDGVAIYNTLVNHKATVTVLVDGLAASAASFIAQAGDEVIMGKGATMMIHDASGLAWGNAEDMRETADILDSLSDTIAEFYADRAGGTVAEWRGLMQAETWYNAHEAVEAGLADRVIATDDEPEEEPQDHWDLSVFNYAGRAKAPSPQMMRSTVQNRLKENAMPPKNEAEVTPEAPEEPTTPEAPEVTPEDVENDETVGDTVTTIEEIPEARGTVNPTAAATQTVVINGTQHTVPAPVAQHLATLEAFATDQRVATRNDYVDALASDGKVTAPVAEGMKSWIQGLTDEQWSSFAATWDVAPKASLFGQHGNPTPASPTSAADTAKMDEVEVHKGVVAQHFRTGTPLDKIKERDSYKSLVKLLPADELEKFVSSYTS